MDASLEIAPVAPSAAPSKEPRIWHLIVIPMALNIILAVVFMVTAAAMWARRAVIANHGRPDPLLVRRLTPELLGLARDLPFLMSVAGLSFLIAALLVARASPQPFIERLALHRPAGTPLVVLWAALGAAGVGLFNSGLVSFLPRHEASSVVAMAKAIHQASGDNLVTLGLLSCLVAPVGEELFFRGAMQTRFVARFGAMRGIIFTSVIFGVFHLDWIHALFALATGLFLGWVAWATRSIWTSIAAHVLVNTIAFGMSRALFHFDAVWVLVAGAALAVPATRAFRRHLLETRHAASGMPSFIAYSAPALATVFCLASLFTTIQAFASRSSMPGEDRAAATASRRSLGHAIEDAATCGVHFDTTITDQELQADFPIVLLERSPSVFLTLLGSEVGTSARERRVSEELIHVNGDEDNVDVANRVAALAGREVSLTGFSYIEDVDGSRLSFRVDNKLYETTAAMPDDRLDVKIFSKLGALVAEQTTLRRLTYHGLSDGSGLIGLATPEELACLNDKFHAHFTWLE